MKKSQESRSQDSQEVVPIDLNDPLMKWLEKPETREAMTEMIIKKELEEKKE